MTLQILSVICWGPNMASAKLSETLQVGQSLGRCDKRSAKPTVQIGGKRSSTKQGEQCVPG